MLRDKLSGICIAFCTGLFTVPASAQSVPDYAPQTVLPIPIRAITDPKTASADQADIAANELVLGVVVNGKARAYPINQLTGPMREIINDELGGTAIAATW